MLAANLKEDMVKKAGLARKKASPASKVTKPLKPTAQKQPIMDDLEGLSPESRRFLEKMEKKYGEISEEEGRKAYETVLNFIQGKMTWGELLNFTPEEMHEMAQIGYGYFKGSFYDKAEQIFKGLAVLNPDHYYYRQMLGAIYQKREQFEEALAHYNDALLRNPDDIVSYTNRGEVFLRQGLFDKAVADFDEAIKRDPEQKNKWAGRARQLKYRIEHRDELGSGETKKGEEKE